MDAGIVVDTILGDEKRAGETIFNALTGRPVSATAATDAAVTIGSDLLMLVPGLGSAAAAFKAGRVAKTASKAAKAADKVSAAKQAVKKAKNAASMIKDPKNVPMLAKATVKQAQRAAKALPKLTKNVGNAEKKMKNVSRNLAGTTKASFERTAAQAKEARAVYRQKRKSPKRRKMRHYGAAMSTTKDLYDFARYLDQEDES